MDYSCTAHNDQLLWDAVAREAGVIGACYPAMEGEYVWGKLVFDEEGRIIDNTQMYPARVPAWLCPLANERWPCYAGQTIPYTCKTGY